MAAANTDKFKKLTNNFSTTLSSAIVGAGDTSMSLASTTNLPTDTGIVLVIDRVNSSGTATPSTREYVKGTVSGSNIINLVRGLGGSTAQAHSTGAVVEQVVDQNTINDLMDGILVQHNQDGSHGAITATSVAATGVINASTVSSLQDANTPLSTYRTDYGFDFVQSGLVWSGLGYGSTLTAAMTSGVVYINGQRLAIGAVATRTFTASKDTYIDILNAAGVGSIVYNEVANNAASPALAANSVRIGIVVSGATIAAASSINQGQEDRVLPIASSVPYAVTDSLGNLICPRDPNRKILGYREISSNFTTASATAVAITGLSVPCIVPVGRKVRISMFTSNIGSSSTTQSYMEVWDGTVGSGTLVAQAVESSAYSHQATAERETTPATTSKTYNGSLRTNSGTATFTAAATTPAFLRVELV